MHDKVILALCTTNRSQIGACTLSERVSTETIVNPLYLSLTKLFTIYLLFSQPPVHVQIFGITGITKIKKAECVHM